MRLIPDFTFEGRKISLQDPYTINNELIVKVAVDYGLYSKTLRIWTNNRNETKFYDFDYDSFGLAIRNCAFTTGGFVYTDEEGCSFRNKIFNIYDYERSIVSQVRSYENYAVIGMCPQMQEDFARLERQGRISPQIDTQLSSIYEDGIRIESVSSFANRVGSTYSNTITFRNGDAINFTSLYVSSRSYIHSYNYKPEYKHHILETESSPLMLGAEIEIAGNTNEPDREDVVKKCIQIMNGSDSDKEDLIYSTSDSTVQIELDTMPCSLEYHKTMNYREMFDFLDKQGYKGHDCDNAGLHIHVDRKYLGESPLKQQLVISKILYILEKFNDEICIIARRNNAYSQFIGEGKNENSVVELYGKYKNKGKHVALNLKHEETIEFRCFRSTLKYETFILTLEFVQDIIDFAKSINIEEIELIKWSDLMDTFSDDLKAYYMNRANKKNNKEKNDKEPSGVIISNCVHDAVRTSIDQINNATFYFSDVYNSDVNNTSMGDPIREKKKEIESLKKRIKNCRNYMEYKKLHEDLTKVQKELKKLKRNSGECLE